MPDSSDTSRCPCGFRCEYCGTDRGRMQVRTVLTGLGAFCMTCCPRCAGSGLAPPTTLSTALRLVAQHTRHLTGGPLVA